MFYAYLLQIYSLLIAAVVAVASRSLTRMHAIYVLYAVASPLTDYIVIQALRSTIFAQDTRMRSLFAFRHLDSTTSALAQDERERQSRRKWAMINCAAVLLLIPTCIALFALICAKSAWFQQQDCDPDNSLLVTAIFIGPLAPFSTIIATNFAYSIPIIVLVTLWIGALWVGRNELPQRRQVLMTLLKFWRWRQFCLVCRRDLWEKTTNRFPTLLFYSVIVAPYIFWIAALETIAFDSGFFFEALITYGQVSGVSLLANFEITQLDPSTGSCSVYCGACIAELPWSPKQT